MRYGHPPFAGRLVTGIDVWPSGLVLVIESVADFPARNQIVIGSPSLKTPPQPLFVVSDNSRGPLEEADPLSKGLPISWAKQAPRQPSTAQH